MFYHFFVDDMFLFLSQLKDGGHTTLSRAASNMVDIDIMPGMTPLQLAAKHSCDRVAILLLLESKLGAVRTWGRRWK